jgi:hypothetical protein
MTGLNEPVAKGAIVKGIKLAAINLNTIGVNFINT